MNCLAKTLKINTQELVSSVELMYYIEELLDSLFTFAKEKDLCNFQKFLNERHFALEEKEQLADQEYISLDLVLTYIFTLKKKAC